MMDEALDRQVKHLEALKEMLRTHSEQLVEVRNTAYDAATAQLETWQTEQAELDNQIIALLRQAVKKGK